MRVVFIRRPLWMRWLSCLVVLLCGCQGVSLGVPYGEVSESEGVDRRGVGGEGLPGASGEVVEGLVRAAYEHSPELKAAFERWQAALERVPQERALPDPTIGYGHFLQRMETRQVFRVEQMFPGFGKRALRGDVAGEAARVAADELEMAAADVRRQVLEAVANWTLVNQSARLVEESIGLVRQLEEVALQRYRADDASQADVLRLQTEADSLDVELQRWRERRPAVRADLNAIIGRDRDHPVPEIGQLPARGVLQDQVEFPVAGNPDLRRQQSLIREAERARDLAQREGYPDVMVGVEVMDNVGTAPTEVMAMVSISVPIWRQRYRAQRREAEAGVRAAEHEYEARFNRLDADARMAYYEMRDAGRRVALFEDTLLPRGRQTLGILEADYRTGRSGFLDLLEGQRELLELELALERAKADYFIRAAEWERITGSADRLVGEPGTRE